MKAKIAAPLGACHLAVAQDEREVADGRHDRHPDHDVGEPVRGDDADQGQHDDHRHDTGQPGGVRHELAPLDRVGHHVGLVGKPVAEGGVLRQPERHADGRGQEPGVEAPLLLEQSGQQRADERADVDAHVEQREPGVAASVVLVVERADQRARVGLHSARAEGDQHQPDTDTEQSGQQRERDVAEHDGGRGVEERPLRAEHAVGQPRRRGSWTGRRHRRTPRRSTVAVPSSIPRPPCAAE